MNEYLGSKIKSLEKALVTFEEALAVQDPSDLEKDGAIQRYEYCYELSWKCLKIYLNEQGVAKVDSPKSALKQGFINGVVDGEDEDNWLEMLEGRNLTVHTYNKKFANALFGKLPKYYEIMKKLHENISK